MKFDDIKVGDRVIVFGRHDAWAEDVSHVTATQFKAGRNRFMKRGGHMVGAPYSGHAERYTAEALGEMELVHSRYVRRVRVAKARNLLAERMTDDEAIVLADALRKLRGEKTNG